MSELHPCPSCRRHVRIDETADDRPPHDIPPDMLYGAPPVRHRLV